MPGRTCVQDENEDDGDGSSPYNTDEEGEGVPQEEQEFAESLYNDGKGIQISASLIGLLPPLKAGEKRRSNAKPPTTTKVVYIHEKMPFVNAVYIIIGRSLDRRDLCRSGGTDDRDRLLPSTPFRMEYTVLRSAFKDVELHSAADWETFIEEASKKPIAHGKLVIKEQMTAAALAAAQAAADDDDADSEQENPRKKKKQKNIPTDEEVAQNQIIKRLTELHMCEDRKCSFAGPCWVNAESASHIHLTHLHLRTWAAAIESQQDGVDEQLPPNIKLFDPATPNSNADVAAMAKRRAAATTASSGSNVYVSFDGLAELLRGPSAVTPHSPHRPALAPAAINVSKWPKMDLATFCNRFELPDSLHNKLLCLGVQGPHVLRFLKDEDLRVEGHLLLGELGTLRDAEERWKNFCTWDT